MRLFLTGATGFLGNKVTAVLAEHGHTLHAFVRSTKRLDAIRPYIEKYDTGDITDPLAVGRAVRGADAVIHMAADLSHWSANRERIFRTNVLGTRIIAEAVKTNDVPTLLHVSSIAAVGYSADGQPVDEGVENNFVPLRLLYHESKRLAELEAIDAARDGIRVVVVNPGVLYGPRDLSHTFGHTMLELARGRVPGHPSGGLSITDVDDVADGIAAALQHGRSGERYLLAGYNVTYEEAFRSQAKAIGAEYTGKTLSPAVLRAASLAFEMQSRFTHREPRLTRDNAILAPLKMWYTSDKAARQLGYRVRPLEETLERMAAAYQRHGAI